MKFFNWIKRSSSAASAEPVQDSTPTGPTLPDPPPEPYQEPERRFDRPPSWLQKVVGALIFGAITATFVTVVLNAVTAPPLVTVQPTPPASVSPAPQGSMTVADVDTVNRQLAVAASKTTNETHGRALVSAKIDEIEEETGCQIVALAGIADITPEQLAAMGVQTEKYLAEGRVAAVTKVDFREGVLHVATAWDCTP